MPGYVVKLFIAFIACFFAISCSYAQSPGKVEVIKDPLIDSLIAKRIALNKSAPAGESGFQVQIYLGSDRQSAYDAQNLFKSLYPKTNTYIRYTEPNYKVQVGDFRNRGDAQRLMNELKTHFPGMVIVPATVN
jgi:hypothetical protein